VMVAQLDAELKSLRTDLATLRRHRRVHQPQVNSEDS